MRNKIFSLLTPKSHISICINVGTFTTERPYGFRDGPSLVPRLVLGHSRPYGGRTESFMEVPREGVSGECTGVRTGLGVGSVDRPVSYFAYQRKCVKSYRRGTGTRVLLPCPSSSCTGTPTSSSKICRASPFLPVLLCPSEWHVRALTTIEVGPDVGGYVPWVPTHPPEDPVPCPGPLFGT